MRSTPRQRRLRFPAPPSLPLASRAFLVLTSTLLPIPSHPLATESKPIQLLFRRSPLTHLLRLCLCLPLNLRPVKHFPTSYLTSSCRSFRQLTSSSENTFNQRLARRPLPSTPEQRYHQPNNRISSGTHKRYGCSIPRSGSGPRRLCRW